MKVLAYLLYGRKAEYELELTLSILSALHQLGEDRSDVKIAIVTDRENLLPNFPVEILRVSAAELAAWQTTPAGHYHFRAKPCALLKVLDHFQCPAALLDTDTYFIQDPRKLFERISSTTSLMHESDNYKIGENPLWDPITPHIKQGIEIGGVTISPESEMLNSGVIGITPDNRGLIEKSLTVLDRLFAIGPVFNVEQLAIGAVLSQYTQVASCNDVVQHYWGSGYRKPFIHLAVSRLMQSNSSRPAELIARQSVHVRPEFPKSAKRDVALAKLMGKLRHWDGTYQFAWLAYCNALRQSRKDPELASIWADTALTCLGKSLEARQQQPASSSLRRDFRRLSQPRLVALPWLTPRTKTAWHEFWNQLS